MGPQKMHVSIKYVGIYVLMHTCHSQISQRSMNQLSFFYFFPDVFYKE